MVTNTQFFFFRIVRACSIFYPHEGYRSVTPLDAARVNRVINICIDMLAMSQRTTSQI